MGHFYILIIKQGLLYNYLLGRSIFLLQRVPQIGASVEHATCGTAGSAPDADASTSAQGSGATGGAPAADATASAGQPRACPPVSSCHTPSLFPHPLPPVSSSHTPSLFPHPHPKIVYFLICLLFVYQKFKFCFIFIIIIICFFLYFHTLTPKIQ